MARSSLFAPHRLLVGGAIVVLAFLSFMFLRGPAFWQRMYYPLPGEYVQAITESADRHDINPYLICAVIEAESDWRADIASEAGAVGLMQVLPETAEELRLEGAVDSRIGIGPLSDPSVNIEYGTAYVRFLIDRYHEVEPALAAYNAGIGNVDEWVAGGEDIRDTIEFPETSHYVLRVVRAREIYEELYPDAFSGWSD